MSIKRTNWNEADIDALPLGEHDLFERKSGLVFNNTGELLGKLAKTVSALANSGGGHILLGVDDGGVPDGVPPYQGRTAVRDWLEQKIPNLVSYPLSDFRVHVVERDPASSRIPVGTEVIVIDVGDSPLAPHQCMHGGGGASKHTYYYRQAGRSEPAPHFYLELLRQRLVNPVLEFSVEELVLEDAYKSSNAIFLETRLRFGISNTGRVTAYKWALLLKNIGNIPDGRGGDYRDRTADYPIKKGRSRGVRMDDTLLPGCTLSEYRDLGVFLRPSEPTSEALKADIKGMLAGIRLTCQMATETSPGEATELEIADVVGVDLVAAFVASKVGYKL